MTQFLPSSIFLVSIHNYGVHIQHLLLCLSSKSPGHINPMVILFIAMLKDLTNQYPSFTTGSYAKNLNTQKTKPTKQPQQKYASDSSTKQAAASVPSSRTYTQSYHYQYASSTLPCVASTPSRMIPRSRSRLKSLSSEISRIILT